MKNLQTFNEFINESTINEDYDPSEINPVDQYFRALDQLLFYKKEIPDYIKKMNPRKEKVFAKALDDFMKSINIPRY